MFSQQYDCRNMCLFTILKPFCSLNDVSKSYAWPDKQRTLFEGMERLPDNHNMLQWYLTILYLAVLQREHEGWLWFTLWTPTLEVRLLAPPESWPHVFWTRQWTLNPWHFKCGYLSTRISPWRLRKYQLLLLVSLDINTYFLANVKNTVHTYNKDFVIHWQYVICTLVIHFLLFRVYLIKSVISVTYFLLYQNYIQVYAVCVLLSN